jgi:hypothetical protein
MVGDGSTGDAAVFVGAFAVRMAYTYVLAQVAVAQIEVIGEQAQGHGRLRRSGRRTALGRRRIDDD